MTWAARRKGIVLYRTSRDYTKGSSSLIRATEGTIVDRLPPRMKIREGALLELPHIRSGWMTTCTVIEPRSDKESKLKSHDSTSC
jgi:hypothetical protein